MHNAAKYLPCMLSAFHSSISSINKFTLIIVIRMDKLIRIWNDVPNLNVTHKWLNREKGEAFSAWIYGYGDYGPSLQANLRGVADGEWASWEIANVLRAVKKSYKNLISIVEDFSGDGDSWIWGDEGLDELVQNLERQKGNIYQN